VGTSSAIDRATADAERSYLRSKATVANVGADMLSRGPSGALSQRADFGRAKGQLQAFRGWVYASIRPIAQKIAGQPIQVGRVAGGPRRLTKQGTQDADPLPSHPILDLLADPNDLMVAWSLIYVTVASLELTGSALWWLPELDGRRQIFPIPTSWIESTEGTTNFKRWLIRPPYHTGEPLAIEADEAVYFAYPNPADPHGTWSPLQAAAAAVDADNAIVESQRSMFTRGIMPSHAVIVGKDDVTGRRPTLTGPQQRQIIRAIRERYGGVYNSGEPIILDSMIEDIKRLSNTPAEMDWMNSSKSTKAAITQGFGTNPIIMGEIEGANRASSVAAEEHFATFTCNPKIELMSQCLTEWLSPMFAGDGEKLLVWIEPIVVRDADMELKRFQVLGQFQAVTKNELRSWAGLPPIKGGDVPPAQAGKLETAFNGVIDQRIVHRDAGQVFADLATGAGVNGKKNRITSMP
jgi:HK97 family phage portal protein